MLISVLIFLWWKAYILTMLLTLKKNKEKKPKKRDTVGEAKIMRL